MLRKLTRVLLGACLVTTAPVTLRAQDGEAAAMAVLAAPAAERATATVVSHGEDGVVTLREGTGSFVCLADDPTDGAFHVVCYHRSLEPYMARGRALRAEGHNTRESIAARWEEIDAGVLEFPDEPTTLFSLSAEDVSAVEPGEPSTMQRLNVVYIPYATAESTGLPTSPEAGLPWIMFPGKATAHVMIHN